VGHAFASLIVVIEDHETLATARRLSRRERKDKFLRWLRSCARCESFFPPIDLYCRECMRDLEAKMNRDESLTQRGYPSLKVFSLVTWGPLADDVVRPLLYGMKGGDCILAIRALADELLFRRQIAFTGRPPVFVHPPATKGGFDHSWALAACLAGRWRAVPIALDNAECEDEIVSQKHLSVGERALRRYKLPDGSEIPSDDRTYVFVDDVITTGSTAMAAYLALGAPREFEVWTVAARPKLASAGPF
jgi:predicted amidophosphoribosyltransferase